MKLQYIVKYQDDTVQQNFHQLPENKDRREATSTMYYFRNKGIATKRETKDSSMKRCSRKISSTPRAKRGIILHATGRSNETETKRSRSKNVRGKLSNIDKISTKS